MFSFERSGVGVIGAGLAAGFCASAWLQLTRRMASKTKANPVFFMVAVLLEVRILRLHLSRHRHHSPRSYLPIVDYGADPQRACTASGDSSSTHDLAWAGQADCAEQVADELAQRYPTGTQMMERDLPAIRTAIAISRGEGATAEIILRPARRHAKTSLLPS